MDAVRVVWKEFDNKDIEGPLRIVLLRRKRKMFELLEDFGIMCFSFLIRTAVQKTALVKINKRVVKENHELEITLRTLSEKREGRKFFLM